MPLPARWKLKARAAEQAHESLEEQYYERLIQTQQAQETSCRAWDEWAMYDELNRPQRVLSVMLQGDSDLPPAEVTLPCPQGRAVELRVSVAIDIQTEAAAMEDSFEGVDKAPPTMARGSDWNEVSALDPEKAAAALSAMASCKVSSQQGCY